MSPAPEKEIKRRAPAPELESKTVPVDNMQPVAAIEGPPPSRKKARPLEEEEEKEEDSLDNDEVRDRMSKFISTKRQRLDEDGAAQIIRHKRERANVLARHGASYRLTCRGIGVFKLNEQSRKDSDASSEADVPPLICHTSQSCLQMQQGPAQVPQGRAIEQNWAATMELGTATGEEMMRQDALQRVDEEVRLQQDADMTLASDPTSGEEVVRQDALPDEGEIEIEQDVQMTSALDSATCEEIPRQEPSLEPQTQQQDAERDQDEEAQIIALLESGDAGPTSELERNSEDKDARGTSSMNPQGCGHQDDNDKSSECGAPAAARHGLEQRTARAVSELGSQGLAPNMMGHHGASCEPLGGNGTVPDEEHQQTPGGPEDKNTCIRSLSREEVAERPSSTEDRDDSEENAMAQDDDVPIGPEKKDTCIQFLSREGVTERPSGLENREEGAMAQDVRSEQPGDPQDDDMPLARPENKDTYSEFLSREEATERPSDLEDRDEEDAIAQDVRSEQPGDPQNDDMPTSQAGHTDPDPGQDASRAEQSLSEHIGKFTPQIQAWIISRVNDAREKEQNKSKQDEEQHRQYEEVAQKNHRKFVECTAMNGVQNAYREKLETWTGTPESLMKAIRRSVDPQVEESLRDFSNESALASRRRMKQYQDDEDRAAREAMETAIAQINQGMTSVTRPTSSFTRPTSSFTEAVQQEQNQAEKAWLEREINTSTQKRAEKAASQKLRRRQTLQLKEGGMFSARAKGKGKARDVPPSSGSSNTSTAQAPSVRRSPSLSPIWEGFHPSESQHMAAIPVERVSVEVGCSTGTGLSQGPAVENIPPEMPPRGGNEDQEVSCRDQQSQTQQEAAEERRRRRKESELEGLRAKEREIEQRRRKELEDALILAQTPISTNTVAVPETWDMRSVAVRAGLQTRTPLCDTAGPLDATREQGDVNMDVDGADGADGRPINAAVQDMSYDMLQQVLEQSRVSESRMVQMAAQIAQRMDEFGQVVVSAIQGAIQGSNPSTTATMGQVAGSSNLAPPHTRMPEPSPIRTRRFGPPGTFRDPVPHPVHKPATTSVFHLNCRELTQELLNKGAKGDYWPTPPTKEELSRYKASRSPVDGPTIENFRTDFVTRPFHKSAWNNRAAKIFAQAYLSSDYPRQDPGVVKQEFLGRLKRIHQHYLEFLRRSEGQESGGDGESGDDELDGADKMRPMASRQSSAPVKRQRRRKRAMTLYQCRLTALRSRKSLGCFLPVLQQLSSGGMSEDESDHASEDESDQAPGEDRDSRIPQSAPRRRRYKIAKMKWRSSAVTLWLRTMDLVYVGTKFRADRTAMPGNQFRQRSPSGQLQEGQPIRGLPRNFYDAAWLQSLDPEDLEDLNIQPEVDINFPVDERRYAARFIPKKGNRVSSYAEADPSEVSQWVLTGAGFWDARQAN